MTSISACDAYAHKMDPSALGDLINAAMTMTALAGVGAVQIDVQ